MGCDADRLGGRGQGRHHEPGDRHRQVLEPAKALAIIDDVVAGKFARAELATIHGIPQEWTRTTLGQITRAVGTGRAQSLAAGGWYAFRGHQHPYAVALGFVAARKKALGLS